MKFLFLALAALLLVGCGRRVDGPLLTETVIVKALAYVPATHGSGTGVGFTGKGDMTVTSVTVTTQAVWSVVFTCQHGSFIVNRRDIFDKVSEGDTLTCHYRERFLVDRKDSTRVELIGYDFIDVSKR